MELTKEKFDEIKAACKRQVLAVSLADGMDFALEAPDRAQWKQYIDTEGAAAQDGLVFSCLRFPDSQHAIEIFDKEPGLSTTLCGFISTKLAKLGVAPVEKKF